MGLAGIGSQNGLAAVGQELTSKAELGPAIPASGVLCVCHSRLLGSSPLCIDSLPDLTSSILEAFIDYKTNKK